MYGTAVRALRCLRNKRPEELHDEEDFRHHVVSNLADRRRNRCAGPIESGPEANHLRTQTGGGYYGGGYRAYAYAPGLHRRWHHRRW